MTRSRLSLLLVLVLGGLAGTAAAANAEGTQPVGEPYAGKFRGADFSPATSREECSGFCVFDERGWKSRTVGLEEHASTTASTAEGAERERPTLGYEVKCDKISFVLATYENEGRNVGLEVAGGATPASQYNLSSVINHCPFPVDLVAEDGHRVKAQAGQWIYDLGASPWRVNDRVVNVLGAGSRLGQRP